MSSLPVFAGLDYHDEQVQVCVLDQEGNTKLNRRFANDAAQDSRRRRGPGGRRPRRHRGLLRRRQSGRGVGHSVSLADQFGPSWLRRAAQAKPRQNRLGRRPAGGRSGASATFPRFGWLPRTFVACAASPAIASNWWTSGATPSGACERCCARTASGRPRESTPGPRLGCDGFTSCVGATTNAG